MITQLKMNKHQPFSSQQIDLITDSINYFPANRFGKSVLRPRTLRSEPEHQTDDPEDHKPDVLPAHRRQRDDKVHAPPLRSQQDVAETRSGGDRQGRATHQLHGGSADQPDIEQRGQGQTGDGVGDQQDQHGGEGSDAQHRRNTEPHEEIDRRHHDQCEKIDGRHIAEGKEESRRHSHTKG